MKLFHIKDREVETITGVDVENTIEYLELTCKAKDYPVVFAVHKIAEDITSDIVELWGIPVDHATYVSDADGWDWDLDAQIDLLYTADPYGTFDEIVWGASKELSEREQINWFCYIIGWMGHYMKETDVRKFINELDESRIRSGGTAR